MAKVSTTELKINGLTRKFDVCYSSRQGNFYVKLPHEIENLSGMATGDTPKEAIKAAENIIKKYSQENETRRRVILVYYPEKHAFSNFSYNTISLQVTEISIAFRVVEEVTVSGEKNYIADNGRPVGFNFDEFVAIEWSEAREEFFKKAVQTMLESKERIREFLRAAQEQPQLCETGGLFLTQ